MSGAALSLGEIEALGQKAARGAGLDWGLADTYRLAHPDSGPSGLQQRRLL